MAMNMDVIALHDGSVLEVHPEDRCAADRCCIHKPSEHPLDHRPLFWDSGLRMMFRVCPHGMYHPDPDDLKVRQWPRSGDHWCDGCCGPAGWVGAAC